MTTYLLAVTVFSCLFLASYLGAASAQGEEVEADGALPQWADTLIVGCGWVRHWLYVAPLCFVGAYVLIMAQSHGAIDEAYSLLASALGLAPLLGALFTAGVVLLRVSSALAHDEATRRTLWPYVPSVVSALFIGVSTGAVWRLAASAVA